jgi:hypothetical protein
MDPDGVFDANSTLITTLVDSTFSSGKVGLYDFYSGLSFSNFSVSGTTTGGTPPTGLVSGSSSTLKAGQTDAINFAFNEAVSGFDNNDVSVTGGTLGAINPIDATHYSATFTPDATDSFSGRFKLSPAAAEHHHGPI